MPWLLIHTHANREIKARSAIEGEGENPWLPVATDGLPAYPGYLFVRLTDFTRPHEISGLPGVLRVVRFGESLALASDDLIAALMQTQWTRETLKPGSQVIITSGPFAHYEGQVVKKMGHIIDIVIDWMHRPQRLRLTTREIEAV